MRATKIGIITLAAAGLLLTGCSSDGDDGTDPQTSAGSETESEDTPSEEASEDDGGGEASDELVEWAGSFCDAVGPLQEDFLADGSEPTEVPTEPAEMIAQLQEQFAQLGPSFEAAREAVESAGPPPIDNGDQVFDDMLTVLGTAADAFAQVQDELAALDPNDPNAFAELTPLFESITAEMGSAGEGLEATFNSPEMEAAFSSAPSCDGLEM